MARYEKQEEPPHVDLTLIMFTSIVLIILTFFILMVSKSNFDESKYGKVVDSVVDTFGIMSGGLSAIGSENGLSVDGVSLSDLPIASRVANTEMAQIRAVLAPNVIDDQARIVHNKGQRIIILSSGLLFEHDSAELGDSAKEILMAFARIMKESTVPISIDGHTDNQPPQTEGVGDNWDISMARALSVMNYLITEGELEQRLLSVHAYAGQKPLVANNSPANRAKNNRVELILDFENSRDGTLNGLMGRERNFDFQGFEFILPAQPGGEEEVY